MDVEKISLQVYGPRNQLLGHCTVPASDVPEFMQIVAEAQLKNAAFSVGSVTRWVVRAGFRAVRHGLRTSGQVPVPTGE